jgi:MFS family permease
MTDATPGLREVFAGQRGRLLSGLLLAEFAAAVQIVAYSTVLPLASHELHGESLYGATLASGSIAAILILALGPRLTERLSLGGALIVATVLYLIGVALAAVAPTMAFVFVGSIVQGAASGIIASFSLTAIGSLFSDGARRRVIGLFSFMWILPSILGPIVNSVLAESVGWRWAMAWPAVVVIVSRLLVGRYTRIIPKQEKTAASFGFSLVGLLLVGFALSSWAPYAPQILIVPATIVGMLLAMVACLLVIGRLVGPGRGRILTAVALLAVTLSFFGGEGIVPLSAVELAHTGVIGASVTYGAGAVAWSVMGLRSGRARVFGLPAAPIGVIGIAVGILIELAASLSPAGDGVAVAMVIGWAIAGIGMGLAYPIVTSRPLDDLAATSVAAVATGVAFAETAGAALGTLLGGGTFSSGTALGFAPSQVIPFAFGLLVVASIVATALTARSSAARLPQVPPA